MIYIISYNYSYSIYLLNSLIKRGDVEILFLKRESRLRMCCHKINSIVGRSIVPVNIFSRKLKKFLSQVNINDTLILFDYLKYENVNYILKNTKSRNIHLWYWNTVNKDTIKNFQLSQNYKINFHTFDLNDSQKYSMRLHNQIYRLHEDNTLLKTNSHQDIDFLFVGMDKGRMSILKDLNKKLISWGYRTYFLIVDKRLTETAESGIIIKRKEIEYHEVISLVLRSKVLIDLTKENQSGLTLRTLEGLFFNKKVLTNNVNVKTYPFYDNNNFLFIDKYLTKESVRRFMSTDTKPLEENLRLMYSVDNWLNDILNSNMS